MSKTSPNKALLYAYLDISHVLMALEECFTDHIETESLEATLEDIREAYTGDPESVTHEREKEDER